jgi:hypothetical protein
MDVSSYPSNNPIPFGSVDLIGVEAAAGLSVHVLYGNQMS